MLGFGGILDVAIGMSFVYLLLSMVCSGVNELFAWGRGLRAKTLADGVGVLLHDPDLEKLGTNLGPKVLGHPLIKSLCPGAPSYLPAGTFVLALLDSLRGDGKPPVNTLAGIREALAALPEGSNVRRQLELLTDETVQDAAAYRKRLEAWFDDAMERVSGVYKRRAQRISIAIGICLAVATGVDSGMLASALLHDGAMRQATSAAAVEYVKAAAQPDPGRPAASGSASVKQATGEIATAMGKLDKLDKLDLPIGLPYLVKHGKDGGPEYVVLRILGLLFTGLAVSLGSPFWFDMLSKMVNLRLSGDPPQTSQEKASADKS